VFGRGLTLPDAPATESDASGCLACDLRNAADAIALATKQADWQAVAAAAAQTERLATKLGEFGAAPRIPLTTLTLTLLSARSGTDQKPTAPIRLHANAEALTTFSAEFALPASVGSGNYSVALSNGQAATPLGWFASPEQPAKDFVEILVRSPSRAAPVRTFRVSDFGCAGGINRTNPKDMTVSEPVDCTAAVGESRSLGVRQCGCWWVDVPVDVSVGWWV
jgi:hypothetical protein